MKLCNTIYLVNVFYFMLFVFHYGEAQSPEIVEFHYPMQLGRSYDINSDTTLVDLFPTSVTDKPQELINTHTEANYKLIKTNKDIHDLLSISGGFSLNVKKGAFGLSASGKYLKETQNKETSVEILIRHRYRTVKKTIHSSAKPIEECKRMGVDQKGTHYVRSIQYGGMLIGSLRFVANNKKDKLDIEAALNVGAGTPKMSVEVGAEFKKLTDKVNGQYRLEYRIYASSLLKTVPQNIDQFLDVVLNYQKYAQQATGNKGVPIQAELYPTSSLQGCGYYPQQWRRNHNLNGDILDLEGKFDDTENAYNSLHQWTNLLTDTTLKSTHVTKINNFYNKLLKAKSAINDVIDKLDVSTNGNSFQFDAAIDSYAPDGNDYNNLRYMYELGKLKEDVRKNGCDSTSGGAKYMGCFKDTNVRDLEHAGPTTSTNQVSTCSAYCSKTGYQYSGLQASRYCFCGQTYGKHGANANGCNSACAGNSYERCGGSWTNSVWSTNIGFGCPKGFIKRKNGWTSKDTNCFYFNPEAKYNWLEARENCKEVGGDRADLASVTSHREGSWLSDHSRRLGASFWLGARRKENSFNHWEWIDETPWSSMAIRWAAGQPNNRGGNQRCLEMRSKDKDREPGGFTWHDMHCGTKLGYVCKVPVSCTR